jgi:beta-lactamase class A
MALKFQHSVLLQSRIDEMLSGLADIDKRDIYLSVVDLGSDEPEYAGHQGSAFVYPASLYKLYIALALLTKMEAGELSLVDTVVVAARNERPLDLDGFEDGRAALRSGQEVAIMDLLDLMITRSDDTAANEAIDLLGRPYINEVVCRYGWTGSQVWRKFMPRELEDPEYRSYAQAPLTMTSTRHLVEFCISSRRAVSWALRSRRSSRPTSAVRKTRRSSVRVCRKVQRLLTRRAGAAGQEITRSSG